MSEVILKAIQCPVCEAATFIMLNKSMLSSEKGQPFKCGSCDYEDTLRFVKEEDEAI